MTEKNIDGIIRRMKNLKMYEGMSEEEVRASYLQNRARDELAPKTENKTYDTKYREKLKMLQDEFAVDMNDANDREMLQSLVRHMLQSEAADEAIRSIYDKKNLGRQDFLSLKDLGDYQGTVDRTVSELQDKLGISRKIRKDKQADDIPQWVAATREKAKTFFDRQTIKVDCPKCQITLIQYWINFPNLKNSLSGSFTCWKCTEIVLYNTGE